MNFRFVFESCPTLHRCFVLVETCVLTAVLIKQAEYSTFLFEYRNETAKLRREIVDNRMAGLIFCKVEFCLDLGQQRKSNRVLSNFSKVRSFFIKILGTFPIFVIDFQ